MKNILVSGGAGYIGSTAVRALAKAGYRPVVLDNFVTGHREYVVGIEHVEGDVGDEALVSKLVKDFGIEAAMHFASLINVGESVVEPLPYYLNNVVSGMKFIAALRKSGVRKFILSSTCAVYGVMEKPEPLDENTPIQPINPYAQSKRMLELMLEDFAKVYDFDSVIFRYFNAAGADKKCETGEWHDPETHLIPNILRAALSDGKFPLRIFGNDYTIAGHDGTAVRDYIHVSDLVDAHIRGLEFLKTNKGCQAFNLGTGNGASVSEVIRATEEVLGKKIVSEMHPRRAGDAPYLVADSTKANKALGWRPTLSDLKTIVETAWKWRQKLETIRNRH